MNRQARRAAAARARQNDLYNQYIQYLPKVPLDPPLERGRISHTVVEPVRRADGQIAWRPRQGTR
jgi:hypothetical protein